MRPERVRYRMSADASIPSASLRYADGRNAMRPVRFVALSEDGQALVLADEVGRLLALPIDERVSGALGSDRPGNTATLTVAAGQLDPSVALSPRDIQSRIRGGE